MSELFRIIYCSRNSIGHDAAGRDLDQILAAARRNNAQVGVTGALLYSKGFFAQILEGPFEAVQQVFERIQIDHRHTDVVILTAENVTDRTFADWDMAYAEPHDPVEVNATLARALATSNTVSGASVLRLLDCVVRRQNVYSGMPAR